MAFYDTSILYCILKTYYNFHICLISAIKIVEAYRWHDNNLFTIRSFL